MAKEKGTGSATLKENTLRVITIAPTEKPQTAKLRVAAYCRVSSDSEDQLNSFAAQNAYYNDLIRKNEQWQIADIYADEGITGTSIEKREDFKRLLTDCHRGRIDRVLVKSISRFARNTKECLETVRSLKAIGVSVFFEEQGIDTGAVNSELLTAVFAAIAQKESESISDNMRWSYRHRMQSGTFLPSKIAFGYRTEGRRIVPDLEKAEIVKRIFDEYLAGYGTVEIAQRLRAENIPCKSGRVEWTSSSICYILSNERYIGDSLWQKKYTTETLPRKKNKNYGELPSYYAAGTHEGIIPKEIFEAAQLLKKQRAPNINRVILDAYPLKSMVFCGCCGSMFRRKITRQKRYWACLSKEKKKSNCPISQIAESTIIEAFLCLYYKLKYHPDILRGMLNDLRDVQEHKLLWRAEIVELNQQISNLSCQNHMLAELKKNGLIDPDIYLSQANGLTEELRKAKLEKERIMNEEADETISLTENLIEVLEGGPELLTEFDGELFCELIDRIIVMGNMELRFRLKNGLELTEAIERTVCR